MPRFYFDIADSNAATPAESAELKSLAEARCHAMKYAGQILCDQPPEIWDAGEWVLTVSDERQLALFTVTIFTKDAASTARPAPPIHSPSG